ncbi:MAG: inositol-3-phosphate synthase [Nitrososphaerota archaeon]|nr:inositol-3-phosphate synthase [Candidatus Bathyarchaeota archaeon]MDW8048356.1 inositol-3-phosphate synthase [Nitrososphaerota archaeon]
MPKIRVGVVGVGNCFAGLAQGIEYYKRNKNDSTGLMHERIGPYSVEDIEFVSAFDVGENKVGRLLKEAIYADPNYVRWVDSVSCCGDTIVKESPILDGVGVYAASMIKPIKQTRSVEEIRRDIIAEIEDTDTRILINYLPVGSQRATEFWAEVALETGCAFVNCIPVFIASEEKWEKAFRMRNLPIVGDDIKAVIGSTITHRTLVKLCVDRGAVIDRTYQINVGGNTDFLNMLERSRLKSKKISKTEAVQSLIPEGLKIPEDNIYIGPSDFIPFLGNTKLAFIRVEGRMFANIPFNMEVRLEVNDKANSGGVSVDAIRCAQLALDKGIGGDLTYASAYYMKHPKVQMSDEEARKRLDEWIRELSH